MRQFGSLVCALRGSIVWGACATALMLCLPVTAAASANAEHASAVVPRSLRAAAQAHPQRMFDVIVQGAGQTTSADAAGAVRASARSRVVKRRFGALRSVSASLTGAGLLRLAERPGILAVTSNSRLTPTVDNPQRWVRSPRVDWFWSMVKPTGYQAATMALVDSGVDASNGEFGTRLLRQVDLTSIAPSVRADGRGHGTVVAGIAAGAGAYAGAAPDANLVSLKVFNDLGQGTTSDVLRACDWLLKNKDKYNIRVANFSLESGNATSFRFDPLDLAVERLWQAGIVVVAAAGNYASAGKPSGVLFSPANDPFVVTVGAVDVNSDASATNDFNAPWSSYGYTVDGFAKPELAAPGRYMIGWVPLNTSLAAERPYAVVADGIQLSGTSFAAPVVSGIAADLLGLHPEWTPDQVKGELMRSATPLDKAAPMSAGVGEVNIQKAVGDKGTPPDANAALNRFLVPDPNGGRYPVVDSASWLKVAQGDASWNTASWNTASWNTASWNTASWNTASWNTASFASASWSSASWLDVQVTDNAATETGGVG